MITNHLLTTYHLCRASSCLPVCYCRASLSEVITYSAIDFEFSIPAFERFSASTSVVVLTKYDVDSTKTVEVVEASVAEKEMKGNARQNRLSRPVAR